MTSLSSPRPGRFVKGSMILRRSCWSPDPCSCRTRGARASCEFSTSRLSEKRLLLRAVGPARTWLSATPRQRNTHPSRRSWLATTKSGGPLIHPVICFLVVADLLPNGKQGGSLRSPGFRLQASGRRAARAARKSDAHGGHAAKLEGREAAARRQRARTIARPPPTTSAAMPTTTGMSHGGRPPAPPRPGMPAIDPSS